MTANESTINEIALHLSVSVHSPTIQSLFSKPSFTQKIVVVNANLPETRKKANVNKSKAQAYTNSVKCLKT
jgi:hypothetical protein